MPAIKVYIENDVQRESAANLINFNMTGFSAAIYPGDKWLHLEHDEEHHNAAVTYAAQLVGTVTGIMGMTSLNFDDDDCLMRLRDDEEDDDGHYGGSTHVDYRP